MRGMSVISGEAPSGDGSPEVSEDRSIRVRSPLKRTRISHGRSLCPSISGVAASTCSIRTRNASLESFAATARPVRTIGADARNSIIVRGMRVIMTEPRAFLTHAVSHVYHRRSRLRMWYRGTNRRAAYGEMFAIAPGEVHSGYPHLAHR